MDPAVASAVVKLGEVGEKVAESAAEETGGLLTRLLGPSADVIGQDWAERLRQTNMARLLKKTERLAAGKADPGWAQPRVANAVFEAAQYANDEIVTDYLSGVLASSREPEGGTDDALPWSSLVSRLSALQLRTHYVFYSNLRQIVRATEGRTRLFEFEETQVALPLRDFLLAIGLAADGTDFQRLADALQGLKQEDLIGGYGYGQRDFFTERSEKDYPHFDLSGAPRKRRVFEPPYDDVLQISFTPFGVQFFLWGVGAGMAHDTYYLDPAQELLIKDPDSQLSVEPLNGIAFSDSYWTEYAVGADVSDDTHS